MKNLRNLNTVHNFCMQLKYLRLVVFLKSKFHSFLHKIKSSADSDGNCCIVMWKEGDDNV